MFSPRLLVVTANAADVLQFRVRRQIVSGAQTTGYEVAVFKATVTDPASAEPVAAPLTYLQGSWKCDQPFEDDSPAPIVDPSEARREDPARPGRDCVIEVAPQMEKLPPGRYRSAMRPMSNGRPGAWDAEMSVEFQVSAASARGKRKSTAAIRGGKRR